MIYIYIQNGPTGETNDPWLVVELFDPTASPTVSCSRRAPLYLDMNTYFRSLHRTRTSHSCSGIDDFDDYRKGQLSVYPGLTCLPQ